MFEKNHFSKKIKGNTKLKLYDIDSYKYAAYFGKEYTKERQKEPHILICFISFFNYKQNRYGIWQFVNGVNKIQENGGGIVKVYFVNTAFLNRFYDNAFSNNETIEKDINKLKQNIIKLQVPYEVISWKRFITGNFEGLYNKFSRNIDILFAGDENEKNKNTESKNTENKENKKENERVEFDKEFHNDVKNLAQQQINSGKVEKLTSAIKYTKEESAVSCYFDEIIKTLLKECSEKEKININKGYITYAGKLNKPIQRAMGKFSKSPITFLQYKVIEKYIPKDEKIFEQGLNNSLSINSNLCNNEDTIPFSQKNNSFNLINRLNNNSTTKMTEDNLYPQIINPNPSNIGSLLYLNNLTPFSFFIASKVTDMLTKIKENGKSEDDEDDEEMCEIESKFTLDFFKFCRDFKKNCKQQNNENNNNNKNEIK